jgi:putative transposase
MTYPTVRISWDTAVKHYVRLGLYDTLPLNLKQKIPATNKSRWQNEPDSKYAGCEVANFINQEIELIKRTGESSTAKLVLQTYLQLSDTYHHIVGTIKGLKKQVANHKETIVNAIETAKDFVSVAVAIRFFNISRATYHNYKTLVINKCDASHFKWCLKQYPNQLLHQEIEQIKQYLTNEKYRFWSKASVYLLALREQNISFCLATFYKYSKLLGFTSRRHLQPKIKYNALKSTNPNQIWCADVTILKTLDHQKHYIHLLIDHFSRKILGYRAENSASPMAIKWLLKEAYTSYSDSNPIQFVTDAGVENLNTTVADFLQTTNKIIIHKVAQKDITQSNSQIEAVNKIIKHQFILPNQLPNREQLLLTLPVHINIYNSIRPQLVLGGNTPSETFAGKPIALSSYKTHFADQKTTRTTQNKHNTCKKCL